MKAIAKHVIVCLLTWSAFGKTASLAESSTSSITKDMKSDICYVLSTYNPVRTASSITKFIGPVFGKSSERWSAADFKNLFEHIRQCDNKPAYVDVSSRVKWNDWRGALSDGEIESVLATSAKSIALEKQVSKRWVPGQKVPMCDSLGNWERNPEWLTNNSEEIFGIKFYNISDQLMGSIKFFVNSCRPIMAEIQKARGISETNDKYNKVADDIIESLERDQASIHWAQYDLIDDFKITHNGNILPLSYVGENARGIIIRLNTSERSGSPLNVTDLAEISKWATKTLDRKNVTDVEKEYAKAIQKVVAAQLFSSQTRQENYKQSRN